MSKRGFGGGGGIKMNLGKLSLGAPKEAEVGRLRFLILSEETMD